MFRFADVGKVWVPVELPMGGAEDGGKVTVRLLTTLFTRDELRERDRSTLASKAGNVEQLAKEAKTADDVLAIFDRIGGIDADDIKQLLERTHDWAEFADSDGQPLGYTRERFEALLRFEWFFRPVRAALYRASREGVAKN
jgi:hypothetical protein